MAQAQLEDLREFIGAVLVENLKLHNLARLQSMALHYHMTCLDDWKLSLMPPFVDLKISEEPRFKELDSMKGKSVVFFGVVEQLVVWGRRRYGEQGAFQDRVEDRKRKGAIFIFLARRVGQVHVQKQ